MPIQDSDLLLINDTSGVSKKIAALKLKQNLAANTYNNYKLLVNKPDYSSRFVYAQNMQASVAPTDYMLVERAGVSYKVNGDQVIDYFPSVPAGAAGPITDVEHETIDGTWQASNPFPETATLRSITYGGGKFLIIGQSSASFHSSDGINWTYTKILSTGNTFQATAYGDGKFVTLSSESNAVGRYSTDGGVTWSDCTGLRNYSYRAMAYGNGLFVAVHFSKNERPGKSTDGITWTEAATNNSGQMNAVAYGNGIFVAVGIDQTFMRSTDGNTWTKSSLLLGDWTGVAYGNGTWVAVAQSNLQGFVAYSTDNALTWQGTALVPNGSYRDVVYADGKFVAVSAEDCRSAYSVDGINWFNGDNTYNNSWASIAYGSGKFVTVAQSSSPNFATYSSTGTGAKSYSSELTLASDTNLDLFTVGDAINMVDSDGALASYTPVTSTITNVTAVTWSSQFTFTGTLDNSLTTIVDGDIVFDSQGTANYSGINCGVTATITWNVPAGLTGPVRIFGTPANFQYGYGSTITASNGFNQLDNTGTWVYIGEAEDLTSVTVSGNNNNYGAKWQAIELNGVTLIDGSPTLSFASPNPDLQCFKVGDNVGILSSFAAVTYSGNSGTQEIKTGFSPDLVWLKSLASGNHNLFDTVRGISTYLSTNSSAGADASSNQVVSFNSDGFTLGSNQFNNGSGSNYVAWNFKAAPQFLDIVTYNGGTDVVNNKLPHSLGVEPAFMIFKSTSAASDWGVYHKDINTSPEDYALILQTTDAARTSPNWNNTKPTSTEVSLSGNLTSNLDYVAYLFADTPGVSSFGEYSGNDSTTGPVINCGFKPGFVMIKSTSSGDWYVIDSARGNTKVLYPNLNNAESTGSLVEFTSTGFKIISSSANVNSSSESYIYAVFAGPNPIEVLDVDVAANTMIVDGGAWEGSDGSGAGTWNQSQVWSSVGSTSSGGFAIPVTNGFNSDITNQTEGDTAGAYFSIPISATVVIGGVGFYTFASSKSGKMAIYNSSTLVETVVGPDASGGAWRYSTSYAGPITEIRISRDGRAFEFAAVSVNGHSLVDAGIPGALVGETQVTGPEKSGTGNYDGENGAVVDVTNSNQEWIPNDNRLGEQFFIKAASTRTGLAILRTQAIKSAQQWQASKAPYPTRSLVIYEGDYYANAGFAAPGRSKWIDLGQIVNNE